MRQSIKIKIITRGPCDPGLLTQVRRCLKTNIFFSSDSSIFIQTVCAILLDCIKENICSYFEFGPLVQKSFRGFLIFELFLASFCSASGSGELKMYF